MSALTNTTWATIRDYLSQSYARHNSLGWEAESDLAQELQLLQPHLSEKETGLLVSFCTSQLPVVLTWDTTNCPMPGTTETTTAACLIEYMSTSQLRIIYPGFGHWIQLSDVRSARSFETVRTYA